MEKFLANPVMLRSTAMVFLPKKEKQGNFIVVVAFLNVPAVMVIVDPIMGVIVAHARNWTRKTGNKKRKMREPHQQQVP